MQRTSVAVLVVAALWGCEGYDVDEEKVQVIGEGGQDATYETDTDHDLEDETEEACTEWCVEINLNEYIMTDVRGPDATWNWSWDDPTVVPTAPGVDVDLGVPMVYTACSDEPFSVWLHITGNPWVGWAGIVDVGIAIDVPTEDAAAFVPRSFLRHVDRQGMLSYHRFAVVAAECVEGLTPNEAVTLAPPPPITWFVESPSSFAGAALLAP